MPTQDEESPLTLVLVKVGTTQLPETEVTEFAAAVTA